MRGKFPNFVQNLKQILKCIKRIDDQPSNVPVNSIYKKRLMENEKLTRRNQMKTMFDGLMLRKE